jgi:hypothetical protein
LAPAADDEAGFLLATAAEPVDPAFDPVPPALAGFAEPEPVPAPTAGLPELPLPAGVGEPESVPVTSAPADPVSVIPLGAVLSEPASPLPGSCWFPALIPALFWPAAAAISRSSLKRFPQALAPAVIAASKTAPTTRWRGLRLGDVFFDAMPFSPLVVDATLPT